MISDFQRQIYDWLRSLYPSFDIDLEKLIPSTNQRIDIYIHQLELAIECDGSFHDKPVFFFVKTQEQWRDIIQRDKLKNETLARYGIDLIRIPYNHKLKCAEDLGKLIDEFYASKGDVSSTLDDEIFRDDRLETKNERAREYRKKLYRGRNDSK